MTEEFEGEELDEEEESLLERLSTVKERIEYLLRKYPDARNSDFYLLILYIRHFVPELSKYIKFIPYEIIRKYDGLTETVRRARQLVQAEGKYLPTEPEVLRKRRRLAEKFRKVIPKL